MLRSIWVRCLRVNVYVSVSMCVCVGGEAGFYAPVSAKLIIYIVEVESTSRPHTATRADAGQDFSNYAQHTQISQCRRTSIIAPVIIIVVIIVSHQLHRLTTYALCAQFNQITQKLSIFDKSDKL